jgi:dipeptidyl aminopeptidase/acylaminoacyl peptidase
MPGYLTATLLAISIQLSIPSLAFAQRPVTVADSISARSVAPIGWYGRTPIRFSPSGQHLAVVTSYGDVERNARVFSLLVYSTKGIWSRQPPQILATFGSEANTPGIAEVMWLSDDRLAFVGTRGKGPAQVYVANRSTGTLRQLTNHPTPVRAYAISVRGDRVVYTADIPEGDSGQDKRSMWTHGFTVTYQSPANVLMGEITARGEPTVIRSSPHGDTFVKTLTTGRIIRLHPVFGDNAELFPKVYALSQNPISPDGRFVILYETWSRARPSPVAWNDYISPGIYNFQMLTLVDLASGKAKPLTNTPLSLGGRSFAWSPDSQSVVVSGTFLPLAIADLAERERRKSNPTVAEFYLDSRSPQRLSNKLDSVAFLRTGPDSTGKTVIRQSIDAAHIIDWNRVTGELSLLVGDSQVVRYQKRNAGWYQLGSEPADVALSTAADGRTKVVLQEDLNTAPNLVAIDRVTARQTTFTDFNPQFRQLSFARVELLHWVASDGRDWSGDLYLPPNYQPAKRYPLVIQTHGCTTNEFWIDGASTTAFAAQALAGQNIVVLQVGRCVTPHQGPPFDYGSPNGPVAEILGWHAAIDLLDSRGLIDRTNVGVIGWSMTGWSVDYAITHPSANYRFAAATVADGIDVGYVQYLATPSLRHVIEETTGGSPIGNQTERETFWRNSPVGNTERVQTPLRIEVESGLRDVFWRFEFYSLLQAQKKPVELVVFPDGTHQLVKPAERLTSQQGNVDWFNFWLKRQEDPDSAKVEQYARWRELRKLQEQNEAFTTDSK